MKDYYKWFDFGQRSVCAKLMDVGNSWGFGEKNWYVIDLYDYEYDAVICLGATDTRAEMDKLFNYFLRKYQTFNQITEVVRN